MAALHSHENPHKINCNEKIASGLIIRPRVGVLHFSGGVGLWRSLEKRINKVLLYQRHEICGFFKPQI